METVPKSVRTYETLEGKKPFKDWFKALKDAKGKAAIVQRIDRAKLGNLGNFKPIEDGFWS
jgi:putative addiction module killer protein